MAGKKTSVVDEQPRLHETWFEEAVAGTPGAAATIALPELVTVFATRRAYPVDVQLVFVIWASFADGLDRNSKCWDASRHHCSKAALMKVCQSAFDDDL